MPVRKPKKTKKPVCPSHGNRKPEKNCSATATETENPQNRQNPFGPCPGNRKTENTATRFGNRKSRNIRFAETGKPVAETEKPDDPFLGTEKPGNPVWTQSRKPENRKTPFGHRHGNRKPEKRKPENSLAAGPGTGKPQKAKNPVREPGNPKYRFAETEKPFLKPTKPKNPFGPKRVNRVVFKSRIEPP